MKKLLTLLLAASLMLLAVSCAQDTPINDTLDPSADDAAELTLRVVDGAESGTLILAGERAGDVYTLALTDEISLYLDGEHIQCADVEDGMIARVRYNGDIMETFPARLGGAVEIAFAREVGESGVYDLCGLYLQVLEDLWEKDSGLNADASLISVDLSAAPGGLTDGEREAIAWVFAASHEAEALSLSYDELLDGGYLTATPDDGEDRAAYSFENGLLFAIMVFDSPDETEGMTVSFSAEKWRSPLGAYWLDACTATCTENGRWNGYRIGAEMIS